MILFYRRMLLLGLRKKIMGWLIITPMAAGSYTYNYNSGALPAGVYYARLQNGAMQQVKAMIKVR